jgi:hypothetical protein
MLEIYTWPTVIATFSDQSILTHDKFCSRMGRGRDSETPTFNKTADSFTQKSNRRGFSGACTLIGGINPQYDGNV